jgi:prepilin-type processing-associated H-X9-DG protein
MKVSCASRMRQLGMMFEMYAANNRGLYPALGYVSGGDWVWSNGITYSYGRANGTNTSGGNGTLTLMPGHQYVGYLAATPPNVATSMYRCPAQGTDRIGTYWYYGYAYNEYIGLNGNIGSSGHEGGLRKTNHRHPSETMLLIESDDGDNPGTRPYFATAAATHAITNSQYASYLYAAIRHGGSGKGNNPGGINVAYLDGHVAWWSNIDTLPTDPYNAFWSRDITRVPH